ncbi:diflavin oxidoreductase [Arenibaculum pallidiluteum]|uniref:diflavin oxidoreductase n=1 Tax=Arenibaculum pallidiluteum TaxID=2812559 RepID=UPI001A97982A|nr:flavodoxin domain-containing protein [Arenibaculum pallidiluteum]
MLGPLQLPRTAPFSAEQIASLNGIMPVLNPSQRAWLSGFLAGYDSAAGPAAGLAAAVAPAAAARPKTPLTILFATESGNAEGLAAEVRKAAAKLGFAARMLDMAEAEPAALAEARNLLVIASTWGEGDPPERAVRFHDALMAETAPRLEGVRFAVLALGDTAYVNFCAVGRRIDARLEALGGTRIADRVECDVDYEKPARAWIGSALDTLDRLAREDAPEPAGAVPGPAAGVVFADPAFAEAPALLFGKDNPFPARVQESVNLNGSRSDKETIHLELSLEGSGLTWEPGDALGIMPRNDAGDVETLLEIAGLGGDDVLRDRLVREHDVTTLTRPVIDAYARLTGDARIAALAQDDDLPAFLRGRQIIDLIEAFPQRLTAEQLTGLLRPLPHRLYSIASSAKATGEDAHLLVSVVRYASHGRQRKGVASGYVAGHLTPGAEVPVFVKPNRHFRLPASPDTPIVMIGPGTGVAPFRAFVQEREALGARGRSWLFFGDRTYTNDFLYQLDWQDHLKSGALTRIDVAFSRDQPEKVYVQHRMWERRAELHAWLEEGAHLYVCGDEKQMAKDVHAMLRRIVEDRSGRDAEAAEVWLSELKRAGRYQRDVY